MTIQDKIGQMLCFGWSGPGCESVNSHAVSLIDDLRVGGVILMGRNIGPPPTLRATIAEMQTRAKGAGLAPLFVAVDQEGGRVSRLAEPNYRRPPSALSVAQSGDARMEAAQTGRELKALGFNWDFAPVLDVNNNPANPVIGDRSFGDDAYAVAGFGTDAVRGFQDDAGILACGKHFPGHGDTDTDSHFSLPRIPHDRSRLDAVELVPFRAAIVAGVGSLMTAHILFPALDTHLPATLSPAILTGLLREELGFEGVIVTDDLEMRGVAHGWGAAEAAVLAVEAGADVLLCCHTLTIQFAIRDALVEAVETGRIGEARLDVSLTRIARAKARWQRPVASGGRFAANERMQNAASAGEE